MRAKLSAKDDALASGILGDYRIMRTIAQGGFGRIYEAEHLHSSVKACIKRNLNATPEDAQLLRQEWETLHLLDGYHSIPSPRAFFPIAKDDYALVLQLIEGPTLNQLVEKDGPLHPEDASWTIERLLAALYFCHDSGVIHGDVKPENIFVEAKKHDIKLIDFGLATYHPKAGTQVTGYTPRYAAPESRTGKPPIPETDLYGAGISLIYALTGDIETRKYPPGTPARLIEFADALTRYDPTARPRWETDNPVRTLSDIRLEAFGRRHCSQSATR